MSRTYKDKKWELRFPQDHWKYGTELVEYTYTAGSIWGGEPREYTGRMWVDIAGDKPKRKRKGSRPYHWMGATPSWWTLSRMTVPKRAACRNWEKTRTLDNLEECCPDYGRKPHVYYW